MNEKGIAAKIVIKLKVVKASEGGAAFKGKIQLPDTSMKVDVDVDQGSVHSSVLEKWVHLFEGWAVGDEVELTLVNNRLEKP